MLVRMFLLSFTVLVSLIFSFQVLPVSAKTEDCKTYSRRINTLKSHVSKKKGAVGILRSAKNTMKSMTVSTKRYAAERRKPDLKLIAAMRDSIVAYRVALEALKKLQLITKLQLKSSQKKFDLLLEDLKDIESGNFKSSRSSKYLKSSEDGMDELMNAILNTILATSLTLHKITYSIVC